MSIGILLGVQYIHYISRIRVKNGSLERGWPTGLILHGNSSMVITVAMVTTCSL
jgi:hypothetical protein